MLVSCDKFLRRSFWTRKPLFIEGAASTIKEEYTASNKRNKERPIYGKEASFIDP